MRRFVLSPGIIGKFILCSSLWLASSASLEAGEVVKCSARYENISYYEIRKITRCVVRMDKAKFGDYLAIKSFDRTATLAEGKVIQRKNGRVTILLTKNPRSIRPKLPVDFCETIPAEDAQLANYTGLPPNRNVDSL